MPLQAGARLGPYEVINLLGIGGMGEVYRARDPRLGRDVAIKLMRPAVHSRERVERFAREARAAAAINHPNLLTVFDIGADHDPPFIVSELLHGETLRDAMAAGEPWPSHRVHHVALQIAAGLAAAHARGIVHRDLKPENVFLCVDGSVKILDFGLARLVEADAGLEAGPASGLTGETVILGTAGYMAPEQACGQTADHRADLFALGAILYELLSGRRAFAGGTTAETLRAILTTDPPALTNQGDVPAALARLVARCLEKRPERRFQSASDLGFALDMLTTVSSDSGPRVPSPGRTRTQWRRSLAVGALGLVTLTVVAAAWTWVSNRPAGRATFVDLDVPRGPDILHARFAQLSHDGRRVIVIVDERTGVRLWLRTMDAPDDRPLAGTIGGHEPVFWSPDDRYVAFGMDGWLRKIDLGSGAIDRICRLPRCGWVTSAGSWGAAGDILLECRGLFAVRASGGTATLVAAPDPTKGEFAFVGAQFLPDGRQYLVTALRTDTEHAAVLLGALQAPGRRVLLHADSSAAYAAPGHLLYVRGGVLVAQAFDPERGQVEGAAAPLIDGLSPTTWPTSRGVSPSQRGDLIVWRGYPTWQFAWYDRQGRESGRVGDPVEQLSSWDLAADGSGVVGTVMAPGRNSLWHVDLTTGRAVRLTGEEDAADPRFSTDGHTVLFASTHRGTRQLHRLDVTSGARAVLAVPHVTSEGTPPAHPWLNFHDWTRDGQVALYDPSDTHRELWSVRLNGGAPELVLRAEGLVDQARFSPDGRWIAFNEFRSGRPDVFVVPFPPTGAKWQVSTLGGMQPAWRGDGRELFFLDPQGNLLAVDVATSRAFRIGAPRPILRLGGLFGATGFEDYAPTADGQRFLVRVQAGGSVSPTPTLIINWPALLRR